MKEAGQMESRSPPPRSSGDWKDWGIEVEGSLRLLLWDAASYTVFTGEGAQVRDLGEGRGN